MKSLNDDVSMLKPSLNKQTDSVKAKVFIPWEF